MAHRLDVLSSLSRARLFYIFDSTSPVTASERFRRVATSARARMELDEWLGSGMAFEQQQDVLVYWWSKAHRGHLPEAAADARRLVSSLVFVSLFIIIIISILIFPNLS